MNPVALRLLNQQLISPQFDKPEALVNHMGAMQAQEYRLMRWAVAMRTKKPSAKAFKKAFDSGQIIRLHLMRGTWQLVSAEDYWPLLELCSAKALAVIKGWMSSNKISIPDEEVKRIREILVQTAADNGSVTKEDFVEALAEKDIHMDDHRLSYHIRYAELSGTLCSGDLLPMKATYTLAADKVGNASKRCNTSSADRDEALAMLARKYFQSRQPATLEDFVWWSGLNINECRRGIEILGNSLHVLIGYKSRDIVLSPDYSHKAHNNSGIFQPIIAHDGVICGNWTPFKDELQATFFMGEHETDIQEEWKRYKTYQLK